jgi:ParB family transcriptional regulator, chromosome partitioning protein
VARTAAAAKGSQRGMGRGLAAILTVADDGGAAPDLRSLPVESIQPNPDQPRRRFDEEGLAALAESLKERGVLQPVLVRTKPGGRFELIAGERRWRAARIAGLQELPAIVRETDDAASLEIALIENMAREDLNPVEQARACAALVEELGLTREEVGRRVGRSRVSVSNLMRLLDLPDEVLELLKSGALSEGHGRATLLAEDHADRRRLARAAADHGWSVRELEGRARAANSPDGSAKPRRTRRSRGIHPDQQAAVDALGEAYGRLLGRDVAVRPRGQGYRIELDFESLDDALKPLAGLDGQPASGR